MTLTRFRTSSFFARAVIAAVLAITGVLVCALPAAARTSAATKLVRYDGWRARVPAGWPVFRLGSGSHVCVRFNRHAVYLGTPGVSQRCPAHAVGRTEAILVTPRSGGGEASSHADAVPGTEAGAGGVGEALQGAAAQRARSRVLVTATWSADPATVGSALGLGSARSVTAAGRAYDRRVAAQTRAAARARRSAAGHANRSGAAPNALARGVQAPGAVDTGLGFDACSAPSQTTMSDWSASPFHAVGVYIGGTNMACAQSDLTPSWVSTESSAGWGIVPIYVGLQAPGNGCGCASFSASQATGEGAAAAQNAIAEAQALGLGTGNPIYYDLENYTRSTSVSATVLAFMQAWTTTLHAAGYESGMYGSELSGIEDLVSQWGTGYVEPDDIWIANWNDQQSVSDPRVPSTEWSGGQRLHQYRGGHTDDYGGASLSIDSDYLDGATAAPGSTSVTTTIAAAPSLTVRPQSNGTIVVSPSWRGQTAVASWQINAGMNATSLSPVATVTTRRPSYTASSAWSDFSVQALSATGQVLGTSGPVATPSHVAIFGRSAFVAGGHDDQGGLPVECFAITGCRVTVQIFTGRRRVVSTGLTRVAAGGGIVHFPTSASLHRLILHAGSSGLSASATVRASTGARASVPIRLLRFTTSGSGPRRVAGKGHALRILGVTDFVSHAWVGGILVACDTTTPCTTTPTIRSGRTLLATSHTQTIGAGEIGYLSFAMTRAGHARLLHARGNQLGASVLLNGGSSSSASGGQGLGTPLSTRAQVSLDAF